MSLYGTRVFVSGLEPQFSTYQFLEGGVDEDRDTVQSFPLYWTFDKIT